MSFRYEMKLENDVVSKKLPNGSAEDSRKLFKGYTIIVDSYENWYYRIEGESSWVNAKYLTLIKTIKADTNGASFIIDGEQLSAQDAELVKTIFSKETVSATTTIDNMRYLFGAPMQYNAITDPRPNDSKLGRSYLENLITDMSLLTLTPGKAEFMKYLSTSAAKKFSSALVSSSSEENAMSVQDLMTGKESGRYYSFASDYVEYMKYVNSMCGTCALLLGIGENTMYDGAKPYKSFDWDLNNLSKQQSTMFSFLTCEKSVTFFIDGNPSLDHPSCEALFIVIESMIPILQLNPLSSHSS